MTPLTEISGNPDFNHADPLVVYYIVEEGDFSAQELAQACAQASVEFMNRPVEEDKYEDLDEWSGGRYRKILKRAKTKDFEKLSDEGEGFTYENEGGVRLFISGITRRSETPKLVSKLQVSGLKVSDAVTHSDPAKVLIVLNDSIAMSPAKAAIAAAHVAQEAMGEIDNRSVDAYLSWDSDGSPLSVEYGTINDDLLENSATLAVIRDAGLTEVEPGSITAVALWRNV